LKSKTRKIKILGINASHRKHWNTAFALDRALHAAEMLGSWVETEAIDLKDYQIKECVSCHWCFMEAKEDKLCILNDNFNRIYPKLLGADGILVASPVYWGSMTAKMKNFIDRTNPFCHGANTKFGGGLAGKVGGVISVCYDVHGGAELTINHIHAWMIGQDMIVVGSGCQHPHGTYIGGIATSQNVTADVSRESIKSDVFGMRSIYGVGKRVAEVALVAKLGWRAAEEAMKKSPPEISPDREREKVDLNWDLYYTEQVHFPREHVAVGGRPGTSRVGFEKFLEAMSTRTTKEKKKGLTYGRGIVDPEETRRAWLRDRKLVLMSDTELYHQCPEFYDRYRKPKKGSHTPQ
jgi:multimeric flavodoxin WrbA